MYRLHGLLNKLNYIHINDFTLCGWLFFSTNLSCCNCEQRPIIKLLKKCAKNTNCNLTIASNWKLNTFRQALNPLLNSLFLVFGSYYVSLMVGFHLWLNGVRMYVTWQRLSTENQKKWKFCRRLRGQAG